MTPQRLLEHFDRLAEAPDAIPRLRQFILDLATRGKLVKQDPNDEPASELLKRIQAEKGRLVKEGELRKGKPLPPITLDELPFDTPSGWQWVRVRQVTSDRGQAIPKMDFTYIDVTAINKEVGCIANPTVLSASDAPSRARKLVRTGDVLYSCVRPYLLNIAVIDRDIVPPPIASTAFAVLNGFGLVLSKYLWIVLRSPFMVECVEAKMRGQAYPAINDSDFALLPLPLPPFAEQHRIVAKVDELMALCDRLEAAQAERESRRARLVAATHARLTDSSTLDSQPSTFFINHLPHLTGRPEHIQQLRQTILNLAVRGKLVSQDPKDEPASELLMRAKRKQARLVSEGKFRKPSALSPIDFETVPYTLPRGWAWARFPELGEFNRGKSRHRPRNDPSLYVGGKYKLVQTGDVARANGIIETHTGLYNDVGLSQSRLWPKGTMCITIAANIADSAILGFDACIPDSVVGFIPLSEVGNAKYFEFFMRTAKAHLEDFAPSTAQKNINIGILATVLIPLPPLAEQRRIVARVDELLVLCDHLEAYMRDTKKTRVKLLDATLHTLLGNVPKELSRTMEEQRYSTVNG